MHQSSLRQLPLINKIVFAVIILAVLFIPSRAYAKTTGWDGGGDGTDWNDAGNWNNGIPVNGDTLGMDGSGLGNTTVNNDILNLSLAQINLFTEVAETGWDIDGNPISLSTGISDSSDGEDFNYVRNDITATDNLIYGASSNARLWIYSDTHNSSNKVYFNSNDNGSIFLSGNVTGSTGRVIFNGLSMWGTRMWSAIINSPSEVRTGGVLFGTGRLSSLTVQTAAKLKPETGCISTRNLKLYGNFYPIMNGNVMCASYFGLTTKGTVDVTGAKLKATLNFVPAKGKKFVLIDNDGTDAIRGTFYGRPEGKVFAIGSYNFRITYRGYSGNDVVITRL